MLARPSNINDMGMRGIYDAVNMHSRVARFVTKRVVLSV